ncbi:hypothetical protein EDB86DRAFT_2831288 [Lactarius hatsudake]|nr:hypothetical protein EDB86DRAFT_2831288 [Lactarius hatsudake]
MFEYTGSHESVQRHKARGVWLQLASIGTGRSPEKWQGQTLRPSSITSSVLQDQSSLRRSSPNKVLSTARRHSSVTDLQVTRPSDGGTADTSAWAGVRRRALKERIRRSPSGGRSHTMVFPEEGPSHVQRRPVTGKKTLLPLWLQCSIRMQEGGGGWKRGPESHLSPRGRGGYFWHPGAGSLQKTAALTPVYRGGCYGAIDYLRAARGPRPRTDLINTPPSSSCGTCAVLVYDPPEAPEYQKAKMVSGKKALEENYVPVSIEVLFFLVAPERV